MGWLSKLAHGDWSNPFDNLQSNTKNYVSTAFDIGDWKKNIGNFVQPLVDWEKQWMPEILKTWFGAGDMDWGAIGSAAFDFLGNERANQQSRDSAREQMDFQLMMSNTAYQRAMRDMAASGLNPMLAYQQGGASTPGGASYKANVPTPGTAYQTASTNSAQRTLLGEQAAQVKVQKENTIADTTLKQSQALVNATTGDLNRAKAVTEGTTQASQRASTAKDVSAREQILETIRLTQQQLQTEIQESARRAAQAREAASSADRAEWQNKKIRALNPTADKIVDKARSWLDSLWDTGPTTAKDAFDNYTHPGRINHPLIAPRHP
ncbi:MAG: DNA pilot protein [Microviridae sp.]|nr:MAG: DNA pilot protein [Microviridae sp.]